MLQVGPGDGEQFPITTVQAPQATTQHVQQWHVTSMGTGSSHGWGLPGGVQTQIWPSCLLQRKFPKMATFGAIS
jgi:hypothetical protein